MAKCWTCGSSVSGYRYRCSFCKEAVREMENLHETISEGFADLARIQEQGFNQLSDQLSEIATILEWGFGEISWQLQQQTEVLRSIDHTLKTPSETKANEWRLHAEELRRRGVLEESEEFFLKALNEYRLDYRIYVGLAETYLQMNKFDKARGFLEKSLPHAPKKEIDYKSYSYRLIGHIYACEEDHIKALEALHSSIKLSPDYIDGLYDFAQHMSLVSDDVVDRICSQTFREWGHNWALKDYNLVCLLALQKAVKAKPVYFYLAEKEKNFERRRDTVELTLKNLLDNARGRVEAKVANINTISEEVERVLNKFRDKSKTEACRIYEEVKSKLSIVKEKLTLGDYVAFLDSEPIADEAYNIANKARSKAYKEHEEMVNNAWKRAPGLIGWPLLFGIIVDIGGCTIAGLSNDMLSTRLPIGFMGGLIVSKFLSTPFYLIIGLVAGLIFGFYKIQKELQ